MNRNDFRFLERLRVRWAEVDMQRIVFNGHYLMYFDTAVAGYWRAMAMPYHDTMALLDGDLFVRKATLEYMASARYDDVLDIGMRCARVGRSSMAMEAAAFLGERLLVSGELIYVFADPATQTSRPVPQPLRDALQAFEAGEPMVRVLQGDWATLADRATPVRRAVFIEEQGIPAELELDEADATAWHAVAVNRFEQVLGTGRLLQQASADGGTEGRIGRMAVARDVRGGHVGRALLDALVGTARERGWVSVVLHAQQTAVGFYARAGFQAEGLPYAEAGIPHQTMRLSLRP